MTVQSASAETKPHLQRIAQNKIMRFSFWHLEDNEVPHGPAEQNWKELITSIDIHIEIKAPLLVLNVLVSRNFTSY